MIVLCSIIAFFVGAEVEYQLNKAIKQKTDKKTRYVWKREDGTEIEFKQDRRYVEVNSSDPLDGDSEIVQLVQVDLRQGSNVV